jgi:ATP-binding cassette subfamily C protein CydCD
MARRRSAEESWLEPWLAAARRQQRTALAAAVLALLGTIGQAVAIAWAVDLLLLGPTRLASAADHGAARGPLLPLAGLLAALLAASALRAWAGRWSELAAASFAADVLRRIRTALIERFTAREALWTPAGTDPRAAEGQVASRAHLLGSGLDALEPYLAAYLPARARATTLPVVLLVAIAVLDPWSAPILLVTAPLLPLFLALVGYATESESRRQWRTMANLAAQLLDAVQGLATLMVFGREAGVAANVATTSRALRETTMRVLRIAFLSSLVLEAAATLSVALVAVAVGFRLLHGHLDLAPALAVLLLAPELYQPLRTLGASFHAAAPARELLARLAGLLPMTATTTATGAAEDPDVDAATTDRARGTPPPAAGAHPAGPASTPPPRSASDVAPPAVEVRDLRVVYPDGTVALAGLSFALAAGEHLVVVGPSGAGKSTLLAVLAGLLPAPPAAGSMAVPGAAAPPSEEPGSTAPRVSGEVRVGGRPLASVPTGSLPLAWVPQAPVLLATSARDNLRLAAPDATPEELLAAAAAADATAFLEALPDGWDTPLGERAGRLSGGQRQRLALARALLRRAPLLLLDEPTSHLDPSTAQRVRRTLAGLRGRVTVIEVSHDTELPPDADHILHLTPPRQTASGAMPPAGAGELAPSRSSDARAETAPLSLARAARPTAGASTDALARSDDRSVGGTARGLAAGTSAGASTDGLPPNLSPLDRFPAAVAPTGPMATPPDERPGELARQPAAAAAVPASPPDPAVIGSRLEPEAETSGAPVRTQLSITVPASDPLRTALRNTDLATRANRPSWRSLWRTRPADDARAPSATQEVPDSLWHLLPRLLLPLRPHRLRFALAVAAAVGTIAAGLGLTASSAWLIATAALAPSVAALAVAVVGVRFFGIARALLRYGERLALHDLTLRLLESLRTRVFAALAAGSPLALLDRRAGDVASRLVADVECLEGFYTRSLLPPWVAMVVLAVAAALGAQQQPLAAGAAVIVLLGATVVVTLASARAAHLAGAPLVHARASLEALGVEGFQGLADVHVLGGVERLRATLTAAAGRLAHAGLALARSRATAGAWLVLATGGATAVALGVLAAAGWHQASLDEIRHAARLSPAWREPVWIAVAVLTVLGTLEALLALPAAAERLAVSLPAAERLHQLAPEAFSPGAGDSGRGDPAATPPAPAATAADRQTRVTGSPAPSPRTPPDLVAGGRPAVSGATASSPAPAAATGAGEHPSTPQPPSEASALALRAAGLRLRYGIDEPLVLDGVDLALPAGSLVGLTGPSGAGKSSLVSLLCGFVRPTAGELWIGPHECRSLPAATWRSELTVLAQHPHLFAASLGDNLRLAAPRASDDEILACLTAVGLGPLLERWPHGLDTFLDGANARLSGGERQRLAIAQVLLRKTPLLVLDEPTAHLDPATEERMLDLLLAHARGRTTLLISHRRQALARCPLVYTVAGGKLDVGAFAR